ncbi:stalk domain-containing protein [Lysinibacillus sp. NPDC097231]|uniref:stalk domain-containing protein n=1 Tax=Lysinibacillus sp. NPDC097231 TaxID=3364142 RepID=UPI003821F3E6
MKKILKPLISVIVIGALSLTINLDKNVLAKDIENTCKYDSASKVNPNSSTMNCLLTETALSYDVPPEIVKAIAEGESGNWRHFDSNGEVIVTADNGIGIMQITNQAGYNQDRLKSDIVYNIQAGVETLDKMFKRKDLPSINGGERDVLEHWYFAIMAYNGTKPVNSPIVQATGERNANAYQERILRIIEKLELIDLTELPFLREHFQYDSNSRENIKFSAMNYPFDLPLTKSKYFFKTNQKVSATTTNVKFRTRPSMDSPFSTLREGEIVTITGPFEYEEVSTKKNHFVWYPVKRNDGTKGYVASSYLNYSASTPPTPTTPTPVNASASLGVSIYINGEKQSFSNQAIIENGSTLVPLRGIFESLGANVQWNQSTQTIDASKGNIKVWLKIGSKNAKVNDNAINLSVPAQVKSGKTLVPLRFISESLGANVQWNQKTQTITITGD